MAWRARRRRSARDWARLARVWPQPAPDYHVKDELEFALCSAVCFGKVPLAQAQAEIAGDWIGAAKRYLGQ